MLNPRAAERVWNNQHAADLYLIPSPLQKYSRRAFQRSEDLLYWPLEKGLPK